MIHINHKGPFYYINNNDIKSKKDIYLFYAVLLHTMYNFSAYISVNRLMDIPMRRSRLSGVA